MGTPPVKWMKYESKMQNYLIVIPRKTARSDVGIFSWAMVLGENVG